MGGRCRPSPRHSVDFRDLYYYNESTGVHGSALQEDFRRSTHQSIFTIDFKDQFYGLYTPYIVNIQTLLNECDFQNFKTNIWNTGLWQESSWVDPRTSLQLVAPTSLPVSSQNACILHETVHAETPSIPFLFNMTCVFFGHRPNVFTGLNCNSDASWSTCALRCTSAGPSGTRTAAAEHLHDQLVKAAMDSMSARGDMSLSQNPFFFLGISGCYKTNSGPQPHKLKHDKQMIANLHQRCGNFLDRSFGMEVDLSRKHRLTEILQKWVSHKLWHTAHLDQNQQNWWFFRRKSCGRCCGRDVVHTPKYATIVANFSAPNCKGT